MKQPVRTAAFAGAALVCFAANSLLCRAALGADRIDAASFTGVRLLSGAVVLAILAGPRVAARSGSFSSAVALTLYAIPFSYAYLRIGAGMGALVLFGTVQLTMIGWGLRLGERPSVREWIGLGIAIAGLVGLTFPGLHAPDPIGTALMVVAGASWGVYTLAGRAVARPLAATAGNFLRSAPFGVAALVLGRTAGRMSVEGFALATASGALASGVGYALWYAALPDLTATRAGILQLGAVVLAALGAVALLREPANIRLVVAGAAIVGGLALAVASKGRGRQASTT